MRLFNKTQCIYCTELASTKEHVPPKVLLEKPFPPNLITFPACAACNRSFSLDEEYLLVLLSQIGTCLSLENKIAEGGCVDRALKSSPRLDERIIRSLKTGDDGVVYIVPEHQRVNRILGKIALGLYVKRYSRVPDLDDFKPLGMFPYNIKDLRPAPIFISTYAERFYTKRWKAIQQGVFSYIFVREPSSGGRLLCIMDFHATAWGVISVPLTSPSSKEKNLQRKLQPELALEF